MAATRTTSTTSRAAGPAPALPPELAGWRLVAFHERKPAEYKLVAPDGEWETKTYVYLERAIAEAQRYLISQPAPEPTGLERALQELRARGIQVLPNGSGYDLVIERGGAQRSNASASDVTADQVQMMAEVLRRAAPLSIEPEFGGTWGGQCWVNLRRQGVSLAPLGDITLEDALITLSAEERTAAVAQTGQAAPAPVEEPAQQAPAQRTAPALPPDLLARLEALGGHVEHAKWSPHGPHYAVYFGRDWGKVRLTRLDRLIRQIEQMEGERAAAAVAEAPAPATPAEEPEQTLTAIVPTEVPQLVLKEGQNPPIVPWICYIHERENVWQMPRLERRRVLWSTAQLVRSADLLAGVPNSKGKNNVFCVPDDATWAALEQASDSVQQRLDDLANELRRIGSYKRRLDEAGGLKGAPNPLTPTVISSVDPDESMPQVVWHPGLNLLPHVQRRVVERHTPQMISVQFSSSDHATSMTSQRDHFPCSSDADWARIEAVHQAAQEAAAAYEAVFVQLGTYADAESDGRYQDLPRPAAPAPLFEVATPPASDPVEAALVAGDFAEAHRQASAAVDLSRRNQPPAAEPAPTMQAQLPPGVEPPVPAVRLQQALEAQAARLKALETPLPLETRFGCPSELPQMFMAPVGSIVPGRYQPRKIFDQVKLDDLAASIRQHGVLDPVKVIVNEDGWLELVGGERRLRATMLANLLFIPVQICDYTLAQIAEISLTDNLQRDDLTPVEEAEALLKLKEVLGTSENQMAERLGKNRSYIRQRLQIAGASEALRRSLAEERVTFTQARLLAAGAPDHKAQEKALVKLLANLEKMARPVSEQYITNLAEEQQFKLSKNTLSKLGWSVVDQTSNMGFRRPLVYSSADRPREWTGNDIYTAARDQRGPAGAPIAGGLDAEGLRLLNLLPCYIDLEHAPWIRLTGTPPPELIIDRSSYISPAEAARYVEAVIRPAVEAVREQIEGVAGWSLRPSSGVRGFDIVSPVGQSLYCLRLSDLQERAAQVAGGNPPAWMLEAPKEQAPVPGQAKGRPCPVLGCAESASEWNSGHRVYLCARHMEMAQSAARAFDAAGRERVLGLARQTVQVLPSEALETLLIATFSSYNALAYGLSTSSILPGDVLAAIAQMSEEQMRAALVSQVAYSICDASVFRSHLNQRFGLAQPTLADLAHDTPAEQPPAEPSPAEQPPAEPPADDAALSALRARLDAVDMALDLYDEDNPDAMSTLNGCLLELQAVDEALAGLAGGEDLREVGQALRGQVVELLGGEVATPLDLDAALSPELQAVDAALDEISVWFEETEAAEAALIEQRRDEVQALFERLDGMVAQDRVERLRRDAEALIEVLSAWIEASA